MMENGNSEEYLDFVKKFETKKTTDDCYTPPAVYDCVKDWCISEYALGGRRVVRPFHPGGDFENFEYKSGDVVIDNPPFSILSKIVRFYESRNIDFFLFAPALTTFNIGAKTSIITASNITYDNGAKVQTNFVTSLDSVHKIRSAPDLKLAIASAQMDDQKPKLPKYTYPANVVSSARLSKISSVDFCVFHSEAHGKISALNSQKEQKKAIFGGGFIVSDRAAAELKAAELKAAADSIEWELSSDELGIIESLNAGDRQCSA